MMNEGNLQAHRLAFITETLLTALNDVLKEVCRLKGEDAAIWLDEFQARAESNTKNLMTDGMSLEEETSGLAVSLAVLQAVVAEMKAKLKNAHHSGLGNFRN